MPNEHAMDGVERQRQAMLADELIAQPLHAKATRAAQIEDEGFRLIADFARSGSERRPALFDEPGFAERLITPPPFPQRWA